MVRMSDLARGGRPTAPVKPSPPPARETSSVATLPAEVAPGPVAPPPSRADSASFTTATRAVAPVVPAPTPTPAASPEPADRVFDELRGFLERVPDLLKSGEPLPWSILQRQVESVARSLEGSGDLFWLVNRAVSTKGGDYIAWHLARVTVLAVRIGMTIGYDRPRLVELGMAAALSGVALWQLPPGVLRRLDTLSGDEEAQYQAYPHASAERVRRWSPPSGSLVDTVLQHREREQGQGFPQALQGAAIRLDAKIVGLAHTYMSLTAPPSLRGGLRPHEAVREIVRGKHDGFPAVLVKALLSDITVFPPGTVVRLNTGEVGTVVAVNRNHPLRPHVEVVEGKAGPLATPKIVDLSEAPFLYITGPVTEPAR
jgi:HD-GYP domain-containing protein (c-di-GMP phosphodiesterase class II)